MTATLLIKVAAEVTFVSSYKERQAAGLPFDVCLVTWVIQYGINVILHGVNRHVVTRRVLFFLHETFACLR
jgi:hypothetical protein